MNMKYEVIFMTPGTFCHFFPVILLALTAYLPGSAMAEDTLPHTSKELGFRLRYPASWSISPETGANLRLKIVSPINMPAAYCSVVVKKYPNAKTAKQGEIDAVFQEQPSPEEIRDILSKGTIGVEVVKASSGTLGSRPAHVAWVRYQEETALGPAAVYGRVAMTATPGLTWTLACSSQGIDPGDAERNYTLWNNEINGIFSSFTLPQ